MPTAEEVIEKKAQQVPAGSFRHTVLLTARRFKSSWVELGKLLVKVRNEALFEEWGYPTFESYCLAELRIKKQTADKLTRNFAFLDKHEPERVQAPDFVERAPAYELVEVLAAADARGQLSAQEYRSVRDSIWEQDRPVAELKRELVEKFPPPPPPRPSGEDVLKRLVAQAKRLLLDLRGTRTVPKEVAERCEALVDDLEKLEKKKAEA